VDGEIAQTSNNTPAASLIINGTVNASILAGADMGAKINAAIAQTGCGTLYVPQGRFSTATVIHKPRCIILQGAGPTVQDNIVGGHGTVIVSAANPALVISDGPTSQTESGGVRDIQLIGSGGSTIGVLIGGDPSGSMSPSSDDGSSQEFYNVVLNGFGYDMQCGNNCYDIKFISGGIQQAAHAGFYCPSGLSNSGESINFTSTSIFNNQTGISNLGCEVNLSLSEIDYNVLAISGSATCFECHIEQNTSPVVTSGHFKMVGGVILSNSAGSDSAFINGNDANPYVYLDGVAMYNGSGSLTYCVHETGDGGSGMISIQRPTLNSDHMCSTLTNVDPAGYGTDLFDPLNTHTFSRGLAFDLYNNFSLSDRARNYKYQFDVSASGSLEGFRASGGPGIFAWNGSLSANGDIAGTTVSVGDGSTIVYRCTAAGTVLPVGTLTTSSSDCGASVDTGLRVH
jgi:hypothetical protein